MVLNNERQNKNNEGKLTNTEAPQAATNNLQAQLAELNIYLHAVEAQEQSAWKSTPTTFEIELKQGDRVIITNQYNVNKGIQGTVKNVTGTGTWIDIITNNRKERRKKNTSLKCLK
eukprot:7313662-Ditylum_brightwellii.AAC.1